MLELKNINFSYLEKDKIEFKINLKQLKYEPAKISCILGKNGSGKSTILNLIGGHLKPSSGEIFLFGKNITNIKAELRPTATVFQEIGLFPHLTIQKNIELAIEPNTIFKKSKSTVIKTNKILSDFDLMNFSDKKPSELSIGQQQRIAIARAVSSEPQILLLDEPTSALDFVNINILKKLLVEIQVKKIVPIIIIVSHDLHFILEIANTIQFIEKGEFVFEGTPIEFKQSKYYLH